MTVCYCGIDMSTIQIVFMHVSLHNLGGWVVYVIMCLIVLVPFKTLQEVIRENIVYDDVVLYTSKVITPNLA